MKSTILIFFLYLYMFLFGTNITSAQKSYSKEIGLITDNDLYTSTYYDRYYTNGTFIYFRYLSKKTSIKSIHEFRIGQQMYTPNVVPYHTPETIDRPFAGYIFTRYSNLFFSNKNYALKSSFELGLLGPSTKSQEIQEKIHELIGYDPSNGWEYQIENTIGIGVEFLLLKPFSNKAKKRLDFTSTTSLKLGTIFSELNTNIYARVNLFNGILNDYSNSTLFFSNLNTKKVNQKKELFLFFKPQIGYALYNATIQGSLFNDDSPVTHGINSFQYELEFGIKYSIKRFDLSYSIIKHSKKTDQIKDNINAYGSIQFAYKFN